MSHGKNELSLEYQVKESLDRKKNDWTKSNQRSLFSWKLQRASEAYFTLNLGSLSLKYAAV